MGSPSFAAETTWEYSMIYKQALVKSFTIRLRESQIRNVLLFTWSVWSILSYDLFHMFFRTHDLKQENHVLK